MSILELTMLAGVAAGVVPGGGREVATLQRMLPGTGELRADSIALTDAERGAYREQTGMTAPAAALLVYRALSDTGLVGYIVQDNVMGKDQPITYAVAVGPDLAVRSVEILAYREAYGGEVRNGSWRNQFVGKTPADPLRPGREITAITGATISSRAVTLGIRRLLVILALVHRRLPR